MEADSPRLGSASHGLKSSAPIVLLHRPQLDTRKKVADYTRAYCTNAPGNFLTAFFVDEECFYLESALLARSAAEIRSLNINQVLDAACLAGAAGVILARGVDASTRTLSVGERKKARQFQQRAQAFGIHVLDYVVFEINREWELISTHLGDHS